ncbi:hypothetical protein FB451DRAFT_1375977 [Mycena latifolia]|nr:hypothetical protein FB451DRAFT_1375977 [Mycena latifolia]
MIRSSDFRVEMGSLEKGKGARTQAAVALRVPGVNRVGSPILTNPERAFEHDMKGRAPAAAKVWRFKIPGLIRSATAPCAGSPRRLPAAASPSPHQSSSLVARPGDNALIFQCSTCTGLINGHSLRDYVSTQDQRRVNGANNHQDHNQDPDDAHLGIFKYRSILDRQVSCPRVRCPLARRGFLRPWVARFGYRHASNGDPRQE